jgi:hypothetical protein
LELRWGGIHFVFLWVLGGAKLDLHEVWHQVCIHGALTIEATISPPHTNALSDFVIRVHRAASALRANEQTYYRYPLHIVRG